MSEAAGSDPFEELVSKVDSAIGVRLCTIMAFDPVSGVSQRTHTNMPDAYPASGTKPLPESAWAEQVLGRGEIFCANDIESIAAVFPDWELIRSLGCESVVNLPIRIGGRVVGTLNCLHEAGHYSEERLRACEGIMVLAASFYLANCATAKEDGND